MPALSILVSALWLVFSVLDYVSTLPSAKTRRLQHVGAGWRGPLEVSLLTGHMTKGILEVGTDPARVSPVRILVSAPPLGSLPLCAHREVSVPSVHTPALDRTVESINRRPGCSDRSLERPRPSQMLFDFSICSAGIWAGEKESPPGTYSDAVLSL